MTPADTVIEPDAAASAEAGPGAMTHDEYYEIAERVLPGAGLGGYSLADDIRFVIHKGEGSRLQDVRGQWYIDYVGGAGALILGHAHPALVSAVQEQAAKGMHFFGTLNELAIQLAEKIVEAVPCAEKIAYATTGSEATYYAMRMARAKTGKNCILKFEGGYHGNHDYSTYSVTPSATSNYPAGQPDTAGIPAAVNETVLIAPYNDLEAARKLVEAHRDDLAAVIVEPVQRIIFPDDDYLPGLRKICDDNDVLLIFDEVVTGFRLGYGGAQEYFGVTPDIASYGKIVGGGGPLGCVAGPDEIIGLSSPKYKGTKQYAYINGTLHGNPVAAAAGLASLDVLSQPGAYKTLHDRSDHLLAEIQKVFDKHRLPAIATGKGSLWQVLFMDKPPRDYMDVLNSDGAKNRQFDSECMKRGLYMLPNVRRFVSTVHTDEDFEETLRVFDEVARIVA